MPPATFTRRPDASARRWARRPSLVRLSARHRAPVRQISRPDVGFRPPRATGPSGAVSVDPWGRRRVNRRAAPKRKFLSPTLRLRPSRVRDAVAANAPPGSSCPRPRRAALCRSGGARVSGRQAGCRPGGSGYPLDRVGVGARRRKGGADAREFISELPRYHTSVGSRIVSLDISCIVE